MPDHHIEDLSDELAVPRKNGELVFEAPWEGRVFGMAVTLSDQQVYDWSDFRDRLAAEIAAAEEHGDASGYYERWLASFERLLLDTGVLSAAELDTRTAEFATGVYDEHEHYETTSNAIASSTRTPHTSGVRNIVWRADGEPINVFRRPEFCADVARSAVAVGASALWLQLGIASEEARRIAQAAGLLYIQDACVMVEHRRYGIGPVSPGT